MPDDPNPSSSPAGPAADSPPPPPAAPPSAAAGYAYRAPFVPISARPAFAERPPRPAWFWPVLLIGLASVFGVTLWAIVHTILNSGSDGVAFSSDRIAVIDLDGVIADADKVDAQLRKFGDDTSVKAIILHINSPGGGAAASQEIFHEVVRIRQQKHKKIVASVESVGASGAYYIASGCDEIYANDASVVGSIGVIMEWTNYGDLMHWARLKSVIVHAGELKDAGDPTRDMTPKEEAYFQGLVDNMYGQFVDDVAAGRHTSAARIQPLATGQVWTGQQALSLGLIDKIGGFDVALMDTARSVGIKEEEPAIVRPASARKGLTAWLSGDTDDLFFPSPAKLLNHSPGFYFLWK
jgi:protease-4